MGKNVFYEFGENKVSLVYFTLSALKEMILSEPLGRTV
jgi:hypothetical protein